MTDETHDGTPWPGVLRSAVRKCSTRVPGGTVTLTDDEVCELLSWVERGASEDTAQQFGVGRFRQLREVNRVLLEACEAVALRNCADGPCFCVVVIPDGSAHHLSCQRARAAIKKARGEP